MERPKVFRVVPHRIDFLFCPHKGAGLLVSVLLVLAFQAQMQTAVCFLQPVVTHTRTKTASFFVWFPVPNPNLGKAVSNSLNTSSYLGGWCMKRWGYTAVVQGQQGSEQRGDSGWRIFSLWQGFCSHLVEGAVIQTSGSESVCFLGVCSWLCLSKSLQPTVLPGFFHSQTYAANTFPELGLWVFAGNQHHYFS